MFPVPLNLPSAGVTAVAAALDGQRIALIAGGRLYVAAVNLDGAGVSVGPPRELVTSLTNPTAVDWGAGGPTGGGGVGRPAGDLRDQRGRRPGDAAADRPRRQGQPPDRVPDQPRACGCPAGAYMYEANGVAYRSSPFERIEPGRVRDIAPVAGRRPAEQPDGAVLPLLTAVLTRALGGPRRPGAARRAAPVAGSAGPACGRGSAPPASRRSASCGPGRSVPPPPRRACRPASRSARTRVRCGRRCCRTRNTAGTGWPGRWACCSPRWSRRPSAGPVRWRWCRSRTPRRRPGPATATTSTGWPGTARPGSAGAAGRCGCTVRCGRCPGPTRSTLDSAGRADGGRGGLPAPLDRVGPGGAAGAPPVVVLLDDIVTTGVTLAAASRVLTATGWAPASRRCSRRPRKDTSRNPSCFRFTRWCMSCDKSWASRRHGVTGGQTGVSVSLSG